MAAKQQRQALPLSPTLTGKILSLDEAVAQVGGKCSRLILRNEIERGRLKAMRIGNRRIGIRPQALAEYLEERERAGVAT